MRVLIANTDSLIVTAIQSLLEKKSGYQVVGTTPLDTKTLTEVRRKRPDILLIYLGLTGIEVITQLGRFLQQVGVPAVAISPNTSKEHAAQVLQSGVYALVPQTASPAELEKAIRSASARKLFLSSSLPAAARQFAKKSLNGERTPFDRLTERQRTILKLIAEGKNTKEMAHRLKVSVKTIEFHRVRLMNRLGIFNVPSLVRFAIRCGLVRCDG
jgi:NarL family two-component system response regulator LiaR